MAEDRWWRGVDPAIRSQIEEAGLDFGHMSDSAAKIVEAHGEEGIVILQRFLEENSLSNVGDLGYAIKKQGLETVVDFFDKYGSESFKPGYELLRDIDKFDSTRVESFLSQYGIENSRYAKNFFKAQDSHGEEILNEVVDLYGMGFIGTVTPHFARDRDLVARVFERFEGRGSFFMRSALAVYADYEKALEEGGEIGQYDITFRGNVQDVGFRARAGTYAEILELKGTVQNMADGSVHSVVQGTNPLVECYRSGLDRDFKSTSEITQVEMGEPFEGFGRAVNW